MTSTEASGGGGGQPTNDQNVEDMLPQFLDFQIKVAQTAIGFQLRRAPKAFQANLLTNANRLMDFQKHWLSQTVTYRQVQLHPDLVDAVHRMQQRVTDACQPLTGLQPEDNPASSNSEASPFYDRFLDCWGNLAQVFCASYELGIATFITLVQTEAADVARLVEEFLKTVNELGKTASANTVVNQYNDMTKSIAQLAEACSLMSVQATTSPALSSQLDGTFHSLNQLNGALADKINAYVRDRSSEQKTTSEGVLQQAILDIRNVTLDIQRSMEEALQFRSDNDLLGKYKTATTSFEAAFRSTKLLQDAQNDHVLENGAKARLLEAVAKMNVELTPAMEKLAERSDEIVLAVSDIERSLLNDDEPALSQMEIRKAVEATSPALVSMSDNAQNILINESKKMETAAQTAKSTLDAEVSSLKTQAASGGKTVGSFQDSLRNILKSVAVENNEYLFSDSKTATFREQTSGVLAKNDVSVDLINQTIGSVTSYEKTLLENAVLNGRLLLEIAKEFSASADRINSDLISSANAFIREGAAKRAGMMGVCEDLNEFLEISNSMLPHLPEPVLFADEQDPPEYANTHEDTVAMTTTTTTADIPPPSPTTTESKPRPPELDIPETPQHTSATLSPQSASSVRSQFWKPPPPSESPPTDIPRDNFSMRKSASQVLFVVEQFEDIMTIEERRKRSIEAEVERERLDAQGKRRNKEEEDLKRKQEQEKLEKERQQRAMSAQMAAAKGKQTAGQENKEEHAASASNDEQDSKALSASLESLNVYKDTSQLIYESTGDAKKVVKAGSLNKLLIQLTLSPAEDKDSDALSGSDFYKTFMLTLQTFTTPQLFLRKLIERYSVPDLVVSPDSPSYFADIDYHDHEFKFPIQTRVCNVVKKWIAARYDQDLATNSDVVKALTEFIDGRLAKDNEFLWRTLRNCLDAHMNEARFLYHKSLAEKGDEFARFVSFRVKADAPAIDPVLFDITDIAQVIASINSQLFKAIRLYELSGQVWTKNDKFDKCPNLMRFITYSNRISHWVSHSVVNETRIRKRKKILSNMIVLGQTLLNMNDFAGLMSIISGLANASVARLKYTFKDLSSKSVKLLRDLESLMSSRSSYKNYRERLQVAHRPVVPFMGVMLSDLTFIDDGNPDVTADGLINWSKRILQAKILEEFRTMQNTSYTFEEKAHIKAAFLRGLEESQIGTNEMYDLSLKIEPRPGPPAELEGRKLDDTLRFLKRLGTANSNS